MFSNMTRAEATNGGGVMGMGQQPNMFATQAPGANPSLPSTPTSNPNSYNTPQSGDTLCVGPNCP
ncbi:hypothetical protein BN341_15430 [Helicobacter heilmannii ASB1.4]|nr:hypothetical protein BN341_15430 [Helicobacter heilmannii ASB1.4]